MRHLPTPLVVRSGFIRARPGMTSKSWPARPSGSASPLRLLGRNSWTRPNARPSRSWGRCVPMAPGRNACGTRCRGHVHPPLHAGGGTNGEGQGTPGDARSVPYGPRHRRDAVVAAAGPAASGLSSEGAMPGSTWTTAATRASVGCCKAPVAASASWPVNISLSRAALHKTERGRKGHPTRAGASGCQSCRAGRAGRCGEPPARGPVALERVGRARTQTPSILLPPSRMSGVLRRRGERHHRQREGAPGDPSFAGLDGRWPPEKMAV
jgi:hypothetical protein